MSIRCNIEPGNSTGMRMACHVVSIADERRVRTMIGRRLRELKTKAVSYPRCLERDGRRRKMRTPGVREPKSIGQRISIVEMDWRMREENRRQK